MSRKPKITLTPLALQMEKDVKRINERINEVAKALGTDSYAYNQWYSAIKQTIPEKYRTTSKHGIIQIARSKEFYMSANKKRTKQAIQRILGLRTIGSLKKEAKGSLKQEGTKKPTKEEVINRMKLIDTVNTFVSENEDMFYIQDEKIQKLAHIKSRKKTYEELNQIIERYNELMGRGLGQSGDLFKGL